jgi:antibiotic biosynthesis monooxygenase (ABM) superfamily enzyme
MDDAGPVTVVVSRRVRPGCEVAYEAWLARLSAGAATMPGYEGTHVIRPGPDDGTTYTSVFRFADIATLQAFERSELRRRALLEVASLVEADATWRRLTGLETWFTPPQGTVLPQPSRWRMAIVLIAVVYGLVLSLGRVVGYVLVDAPPAARLLVTIILEVVLMTYVLMPRLTSWLAPWIYPRKDVT